MAPKITVLGICVASLALGISVLVTASMTIDYFRPSKDFCDNVPIKTDLCEMVDYWLAAGSLGIIAGLIQIGTIALGWMEKTKHWSGLHILISAMTLIVCIIAISKDAFAETTVPIIGTKVPMFPDKVKAFTVLSGLDALFSIVVAIVMFRL